MEVVVGYALEQSLTVALSGTADAKESLQAFVEKHSPSFTRDIGTAENFYRSEVVPGP